jgi:hypothetical protein
MIHPQVRADKRPDQPALHRALVVGGTAPPAVLAVEQPVGGVDVDLGAGAAHVPVDDIPEDREQVAHQGVVAGGLVIGADGLKEPQGGVDGVLLRCLAFVGEAVR